MTLDYAIVGSGFGGAVSACRLAAAGRKVLVLERGRRWAPQDYPRDHDDPWIWDPDEPERQNGWIDLRIMDQMWVAQGAGVGGGSLIYANISIDAPPDMLKSGWPSQISLESLAPFYARAGQMLGGNPLPDGQLTKRFKLMREAANSIGAGDRFRKVDMAVTFDPDWNYGLIDAHNERHSRMFTNPQGRTQGTCIHCGNCDIGCTVQAKNTLDLNYLAAAENDGAEIRPMSLVTHIGDLGDRWQVHYQDISQGTRINRTVEARAVILAAGSLGSTEILLRSRDQYKSVARLPKALGHGWSSNGDFLTPAVYENRAIDPTVGPTISSAIDFLDGSEGGQFFVEDGGFPNVLKNYLDAQSRAKGAGWLEKRVMRGMAAAIGRSPLETVMPWFGQAIDGGDGKLYLGRDVLRPWKKKLKLNWNPRRSETGVGGLAAMHVKLSHATGGEPQVPPAWSVFRNLVTPHPLGGCNMAAGPAIGVVDHAGQVFGHERLYVLDGAIVPRPIGLNPSKTIAALAERACALMLDEKSA